MSSSLNFDTPDDSKKIPLASLLRYDNREQLLRLLSLDPHSDEPSIKFQSAIYKSESELLSSINSINNVRDINCNPTIPDIDITEVFNHRQRLHFGSESLRYLILRHVLPDSYDRVNFLKKIKHNINKCRTTKFSTIEESWDLVDNKFGIVGAHLLANPHNENDQSISGMNITDFATSSKTSYNVGTNFFSEKNHLNRSYNDNYGNFTDGNSVALYFIAPKVLSVQLVCNTIRMYHLFDSQNSKALNTSIKSSQKIVIKHRIIFIPRSTELTSRILKDEKIISGKITIHNLDIDLIPMDDDVFLCANMEDVLQQCDIDGIPSYPVNFIARSINRIQDLCGYFSRMISFGVLGEKVINYLLSSRLLKYDPHDKNKNHSLIEIVSNNTAIIIDRKVDLITPMMTPLTFEGLLDDIVGVNYGFVKVDASIVEPPENTVNKHRVSGSQKTILPTHNTNFSPKISIPLNDYDSLYSEVRDQHVEKFGSFLQDQAKTLKECHDNFSDKNQDLSEIHQFVKQIPIFTKNLRSLTNHIYLAELIKESTERSEFRQRWQTEHSLVESETCYDTIEELIACQYPPYRLLQLVCLQSLTDGGLKANKFDSLRRDIVQTYGYKFMITLRNLEKIGLLRKRESIWKDSNSPFVTIRKQLSLIKSDVDVFDPDDVSYVSSGYAPITLRLIESTINGWVGKENALRELPGRYIYIRQFSFPQDFATATRHTSHLPLEVLPSFFDNNSVTKKKNKKPILLIYYVGGVSYMEIAGMRYMSKKTKFPYKIICCCTSIINGSSFLLSLGQ